MCETHCGTNLQISNILHDNPKRNINYDFEYDCA